MKAILLTAGEGAHFRPLTVTRPKGMSIVAGKPILQHTVETLAEVGVKDVLFVVGYKPERVRTFFGSGAPFGINATYVTQETPTGTGDALRRALPSLGAPSESLVLFGDNHYEPDHLRQLLSVKGNALLAAGSIDPQRQGRLVSRAGRLVDYEYPSHQAGGISSTGAMKFAPDFLSFLGTLPPPESDQLPWALRAFAKAGNLVHVLVTEDGWDEAETPWDLLRLNEHLLLEAAPESPTVPSGVTVEGPVHVGANTRIRPGARLVGPVHIGSDCEIGEGAIVGPNVSLRNNVHIGAHSEVRNTIVNNNVYIDSQCILRFSIVDDGVRIGPFCVLAEGDVSEPGQGVPARRGAIVGPDSRLGTRVTLRPGSRLPENTVVEDHKIAGSVVVPVTVR